MRKDKAETCSLKDAVRCNAHSVERPNVYRTTWMHESLTLDISLFNMGLSLSGLAQFAMPWKTIVCASDRPREPPSGAFPWIFCDLLSILHVFS